MAEVVRGKRSIVSDVDSVDEETDKDELRRERLNERARLLWLKLKSALITTLTLKNIANAVFVLGVCIICVQQCYNQVNEYLKYSTRIRVSHTFPTSTLWLIPGLTVCNQNRVRLSKLTEHSPTLRSRLRIHLNESSLTFLNEQKRVEMMKRVKEIIDETVNISSLIVDSPIPKLLELSRTPMIRDINCNGQWGRQFNCENFRIIESYQAGPCYTMFYLGTLLEALASGRAYDFNSSLLGGRKKVDAFESHEIVEVLVDLEPYQHADFQWDVGGKIVVHSTGHVGSIRDMAHTILPGHSYDVIVQRTMTKRLQPPYKSMCYDYKFVNSHHFTDKEGSFPSIELDKSTCVRNCILRQTTKSCNCWPVEVPYFLGDTMINGSESYKMCPWSTEGPYYNYSAAIYVDCYKRFHNECRNLCHAGCRTEDYKVNVMAKPWPPRELILKASDEFERRELLRLKGCCARISLKYHEFMENRNIMYPSMTLAQLVSNIGGIVSALVGVSAVTIYRYATKRVLRCKVVSDYVPPSILLTTNRPTTSAVATRVTLKHRLRSKLRKQVVPINI